jgi:hypothetical protein
MRPVCLLGIVLITSLASIYHFGGEVIRFSEAVNRDEETSIVDLRDDRKEDDYSSAVQ